VHLRLERHDLSLEDLSVEARSGKGLMLGAITEREIRSQPHVWRAVLDRLAEHSGEITGLLSRADSVLLVGCGSSYYGSVATAELLRRGGLAALPLTSGEYVQRPPAGRASRAGDQLLIAFSRSGRTSETREAVEVFRQRHPTGTAIAVTCDPDSPLAERAHQPIVIPEAQEKAIPQTRSVSAFWLLALLVGARLRGIDARPNVIHAADWILRREESLWDRLAAGIEGFQRVVLLGGGIGFALAHEANLKVMEMAHADSWGYLTLEFRHAPLEVIDERTLLVAPLGDEPTAAEAEVIDEAARFSGSRLDVPALLGLPPGPGNVLGQLYALHTVALLIARAAGRDCDVLERLERFVETTRLEVECLRALPATRTGPPASRSGGSRQPPTTC
jgi:glutamine---fructose-6-phosphate transaminase (isomerizing)